jgi:hypothetical protein
MQVSVPREKELVKAQVLSGKAGVALRARGNAPRLFDRILSHASLQPGN